MSDDPIAWLRAQIAWDLQVVGDARPDFFTPETLTIFASVSEVHFVCMFNPVHMLATLTSTRKVLGLHEQIPCMNCEDKGRKPGTSCVSCHHGDSDEYYDGTCATTRALIIAYADRPGFNKEWVL
jgi:hypothetical protein